MPKVGAKVAAVWPGTTSVNPVVALVVDICHTRVFAVEVGISLAVRVVPAAPTTYVWAALGAILTVGLLTTVNVRPFGLVAIGLLATTRIR